MNDEARNPLGPPDSEQSTLGMSSVYRLFEAFIALREKNDRQHKSFEQTVNRARDSLQDSFNTFAAQTQKAYQQLRQEFQGEKRISLTLLNELLDLALEFDHIVTARPTLPAVVPAEFEPVARWMEALEVQNRKVQAALTQHGIYPYDAVLGSSYNPALHERVGSRRIEGMDALRIAEQRERGYASQQPEFVLRRPKVIVSD